MGKTFKDRHSFSGQWKRKVCFGCGKQAEKLIDKLFCSATCKQNVLRDPYRDSSKAVTRRIGIRPASSVSTAKSSQHHSKNQGAKHG